MTAIKRVIVFFSILSLTSNVFAAFTEDTAYKIEVLNDGQIQVRRSDIVLKDGVEIARTYHRHVLSPTDDVSKEVDRVQDIAGVVWTPTLIAEFEAAKAEKES